MPVFLVWVILSICERINNNLDRRYKQSSVRTQCCLLLTARFRCPQSISSSVTNHISFILLLRYSALMCGCIFYCYRPTSTQNIWGEFRTFYFYQNLWDTLRIAETLRRIRVSHLPFSEILRESLRILKKIKSAKRASARNWSKSRHVTLTNTQWIPRHGATLKSSNDFCSTDFCLNILFWFWGITKQIMTGVIDHHWKFYP